jgi:hypothetical protein
MNKKQILLTRMNALIDIHSEAIKWINRTMFEIFKSSDDAPVSDWEYVKSEWEYFLHYKEDLRRQFKKTMRLINDAEKQINQKLND